jgi:hypothetical protein
MPASKDRTGQTTTRTQTWQIGKNSQLTDRLSPRNTQDPRTKPAWKQQSHDQHIKKRGGKEEKKRGIDTKAGGKGTQLRRR